MSEMSEIHCTNLMRLILFMSETSEILYYSCEELDSESELHELELPLELLFMILLITWLVLNNIFGRGRLNPKLSFNFLAGGWDGVAVDVLVEGVGGVKDSAVRGRGCLGVEKRVGVSFIRAEAATEAMVVSIDSRSKSSRSNESTRETSFVASATVLKETSLLGVGALGLLLK